MKNIDLKKIRHVVEVAHSESITTAARTLSISQPALTRSIAYVEKQLGVQLFVRLRRGMRLTEAGQVFIEQARRVVKSVDDLLVNTEDYLNLKLGRLRIGVAPAAYQRFMAEPIAKIVSDYPGMRLEIASGSAEQLAPKVISGDLDLLWGAARPLVQWPELKVTVLLDFHYGFIIRKHHPLTRLKKVKEADLLKYPISMPATVEPALVDIAQRYAPNGLPPVRPQYLTDDFEIVKTIVARTDAFSPMASLSPTFGDVRKDFVVLEDVVDMPPQRLAYAVSNAKSTGPGVEAFVNSVKDALVSKVKRASSAR